MCRYVDNVYVVIHVDMYNMINYCILTCILVIVLQYYKCNVGYEHWL